MTQFLNPFSGRQWIDANGNPYIGAKLFSYTAGTSTKATLTRDEAGSSNHTNPIILNARGEPADAGGSSQAMWQSSGVSIKLVLAPSTDTDPPLSAISTWDNLDGINDGSLISSEWIAGPAPTYVSATSFTLVGDQTAVFHVGRRLKTTNTGGTIYSTITVSAYTTLTTITVINDSGVLDSGLSAVSYGILTSSNSSVPSIIPHLVNFTAGIGPDYIQNIGLAISVATKALTVALKTKALADPTAGTPVEIAFRNRTESTGDYVVRQIIAAHSIVVPNGATLGFVNSEDAHIYIYACDNGTIRETGLCKKVLFDEARLHNTTAISATADSDNVLYTTTAMTNAAVRLTGHINITTGVVAGEWDSSPARVYVGSTNGPRPVAAGYTRIAPNMCYLITGTTPSLITSVRDVVVSIPSPSVYATALILWTSLRCGSANVIGARSTTLNIYNNSGVTVEVITNHSPDARAYEHSAVVSGTLLARVDSIHTYVPAYPGAGLWCRLNDDSGNNGAAFAAVLGYYD